MKLRVLVVLLLFLSGVWILSCQSKSKLEQNSSWSGEMQSMAKEVYDLLPFVYSPAKFKQNENHEEIAKKIEALEKTIHQLPEKTGEQMLGEDPIVGFTLKNLKDDVERSLVIFNEGNKEYARTVLRNSLNYCFRCHTRTNYGPEFKRWGFDVNKMAISPTSKARLLVATRQYEAAQKTLEDYLTTKTGFYNKPFEQENALDYYLSLMVRVQQNPTQAMAVFKQVKDNPNIPVYLKESVAYWMKSLKSWMAEKKKVISFAEAKKLIKKARSISQWQSLDSANVEYLRASSMIHDLLIKEKDPKNRAEMFMYLGDSYDVLSKNGYWELPELYYESCIKENPGRNSISRKCFLGYERNILLGYSGSIGVLVPAVEKEKLLKLKKLAGLAQ